VADVVVIVPVLRRPHRVGPLLDSITAATDDGAWRMLFVASPEDEAEQQAVKAEGGDLLVIDQPNAPGDWARKINAGYRATTEPLMLLGGDDMDFHPGWLEAAKAAMCQTTGVVGTNDLHNGRVIAGDHSTHPIVARWYVDRYGTADEAGKVVHEGYAHNWPDTELVETAKRRGAWAFARDSVVEHFHPLWGNAEMDEVYVLGRSRFDDDRRLFQQRRTLWT
jgi:glycosyltransferase involved in cell wall biosynthesis